MTQVRLAQRHDALIVAALALAFDLDRNAENRPGFLSHYADAWLADFDRRPTWLACEDDGNAVGFVQTVVVSNLPSLLRANSCWLQVSAVFVRPEQRRRGTAESMLRSMLVWGRDHGVERYQLSEVPEARGLCERVGLTGSQANVIAVISQI